MVETPNTPAPTTQNDIPLVTSTAPEATKVYTNGGYSKKDSFETFANIEVPEKITKGATFKGFNKKATTKILDDVLENEGGEKNGLQNATKEGKKEKEVKVLSVSDKAEVEEKKEEVSATPKPPSFKAKYGDSEIEVAEDAVFTLKIDGKEETVTLKDLTRNFQGKIPWEKHYKETKELETKVQHEKTQFTEQKKLLETQLDEILSLAETDPPKMLQRLAMLRGKSPVDILPIWIKQAQNTVKELENLSEEDLQRFFKEKGLEYQKLQLETKEKDLTTKESTQKLANYYSGKIRANNITQEEETIASSLINGADPNFLKGKTSEQIIDMGVDAILKIHRPFSRITEVVTKVSPDKVSDREAIQEIKSILDATTKDYDYSVFSDSDIEYVVREYLGITPELPKEVTEPPKEEKEVEVSKSPSKDSIKESPKKTTSPKTPQKKERTETEMDDDPLTIDDILRPYKKGR